MLFEACILWTFSGTLLNDDFVLVLESSLESTGPFDTFFSWAGVYRTV